MAKANGFAVLLAKDRMDAFLGCVADERAFAEPVADFQHSRTAPLVCFVIDSGKLTHIRQSINKLTTTVKQSANAAIKAQCAEEKNDGSI